MVVRHEARFRPIRNFISCKRTNKHTMKRISDDVIERARLADLVENLRRSTYSTIRDFIQHIGLNAPQGEPCRRSTCRVRTGPRRAGETAIWRIHSDDCDCRDSLKIVFRPCIVNIYSPIHTHRHLNFMNFHM